MGFVNVVGKYKLGRTIGEGMFAKVKVAIDTTNNHCVAIKIIDKLMVKQNNLIAQVQREIRTMKLLNHPNIVRIYEVLGTKTKIYIVMEYVSGGQLMDKLLYLERLSETEARKVFQQLVDAVDHCHNKGVYHRDLKPENLLLDNNGNIKVTDFGLSALRKPSKLLSTACGSPSYVAPELVMNKGYNGAPADIWSCGVVLFELIAGFLPFEDRNLMSLYRKISRAQYEFPKWFTESQKKLISRILEPDSIKRITIPEIIEDEWFQKDYVLNHMTESKENVSFYDDVNEAFIPTEEKVGKAVIPKSSSFINAFRLIAMSSHLDLSGLFQEEDDDKQKTRFGSKYTFSDTIKKIESAATDVSLSVERMNNAKMRMHIKQKTTRCSRSYFELSAEVIEVAPTSCVVDISKSAGELRVYKQFCTSLSSLLTESSESLHEEEAEKDKLSHQSNEGIENSKETNSDDVKDLRGYSSA